MLAVTVVVVVVVRTEYIVLIKHGKDEQNQNRYAVEGQVSQSIELL